MIIKLSSNWDIISIVSIPFNNKSPLCLKGANCKSTIAHSAIICFNLLSISCSFTALMHISWIFINMIFRNIFIIKMIKCQFVSVWAMIPRLHLCTSTKVLASRMPGWKFPIQRRNDICTISTFFPNALVASLYWPSTLTMDKSR